jgi:hypothetical protein
MNLAKPGSFILALAAKVITAFSIYADGADLAEIALTLRSRIEGFVAPYGTRVRVLDRRRGDLPAGVADWHLGVNFEIEALADDEKSDLLLFFQSLSIEFGRDFIVGGALPHGQFEDFAWVSAGESLEQAFDLLLGTESPLGMGSSLAACRDG